MLDQIFSPCSFLLFLYSYTIKWTADLDVSDTLPSSYVIGSSRLQQLSIIIPCSNSLHAITLSIGEVVTVEQVVLVVLVVWTGTDTNTATASPPQSLSIPKHNAALTHAHTATYYTVIHAQ